MRKFIDILPPWLCEARLWLAVGVLVYSAILIRHVGASAGGSDSSGYLNHARLIAEGASYMTPKELPGLPASSAPTYLYAPLGFKPREVGEGLVATYPIGLSLILLLFSHLVGWSYAGDWMIILHSVLGLLLVYSLGKAVGLSRAWALLGAAILAASPLYLFFSLHLMSDVPALVWVAAAMLAAYHSRNHGGWSVVSGFALAVAVLIRPSNLLAIIPMLVAMGLSPKRLIGLVAGGLPGALVMLWFNTREYGSPFITGYGDASLLFNRGNILSSLYSYFLLLPIFYTPLILLGLALPLLDIGRSRVVVSLGLWAFVFLAFYAPYFHTHETWTYLRFILPAIPALLLAALLVAQRLCATWEYKSWGLRAYVAGLVLVALNLGMADYRLHVLEVGYEESIYHELAQWTQAHLPPNAIVANMQSSGALSFYTTFTLVRWDMMDAASYKKIKGIARDAGRPLVAVIFPFEKDEALTRKMPGVWKQIGTVRYVTLWQLENP